MTQKRYLFSPTSAHGRTGINRIISANNCLMSDVKISLHRTVWLTGKSISTTSPYEKSIDPTCRVFSGCFTIIFKKSRRNHSCSNSKMRIEKAKQSLYYLTHESSLLWETTQNIPHSKMRIEKAKQSLYYLTHESSLLWETTQKYTSPAEQAVLPFRLNLKWWAWQQIFPSHSKMWPDPWSPADCNLLVPGKIVNWFSLTLLKLHMQRW